MNEVKTISFLPKLQISNFEHVAIFFYIKGAVNNIEDEKSIETAAYDFQRLMGWDEDDKPFSSIKMVFYRMLKKHKDYLKSNKSLKNERSFT